MNENGYRTYVLNNMPRLLSQLDRDKNSMTYGCFDRNYWHYKIRDFPSMVLPQGSLTLALLYTSNFEGNIYYKNGKIKEWAVASIHFWMDNQLKDGSFNEYWPNEHGYPPTVFSLYTTSEAYRLLHTFIDKRDNLEEALIKSCNFISKHDEKGAQNQEIASIAALYSVYLSIKEEWLLKIIDEKVKRILERQSHEGWFSEYGGADIGYLSVSLGYLAEYYKMSQDKRLFPALKRIVDFMQFFIHPDYTTGGDYGSRNTEYFLPNGLEILAADYSLAGAIADKLLNNLVNYQILPNTVDDRYLSHYFLHSYVSALLNYKPRSNMPKLPCETKCEQYFKDAGLYVINNGNYYAILGLSKGGVLKVFSQGKEILNDCGYIAKISKNKLITTNWVDQNYKKEKNENTFTISGNFHLISQHLPTPLKHFLLRGASSIFSKRLIPVLKRKLITSDITMPIIFRRKVSFYSDKIVIDDIITSEYVIKELSSLDGFSFRYVPSSKYFQINEIKRIDDNKTFENVKKIVISKEIDCINEKISISYTIFDK
ncbi:MAG TPA: hypothetical protein ENG48_08460 [Candidatus Atribacteria bacterium]|nr:hypothetical protein [Candidatus Atribacteria bacterium]